MIFSKDLELSRDNVLLLPLTEIYFEDLTKLAVEKNIWKNASELFNDPIIFKERWLNKAMHQMNKGERQCFIVFYNNQIVGSSSYYEIDEQNKKLNIGYTWFHPTSWGTKINPITKLIMLGYALESLQFNRVAFCVDLINTRSCNALEKLGIRREGILRNHLILPNGRIRDSVIFSVIHEEWLEVKKNIEKVIESS